jgi:hypothetical protein
MANVGYDSSFDFGVVAGEGDFPNILNLGGARIGRFTVDVYAKRDAPETPIEAADGVLVEIYGGDDEDADGGIIGARMCSAAELNGAGFVKTAISPSGWRYIRASVTGEFTGGSLSAALNTFIGK